MNAWDFFVVMGATAIGGGIAGATMFYLLLERLVFDATSRHRAGAPPGPPDPTSGPGATAPAASSHPGPEVAPKPPWVQQAPQGSADWQQPPLIDPRELLTAPPIGDPAGRPWRDMPPARVTPLVREHLG